MQVEKDLIKKIYHFLSTNWGHNKWIGGKVRESLIEETAALLLKEPNVQGSDTTESDAQPKAGNQKKMI